MLTFDAYSTSLQLVISNHINYLEAVQGSRLLLNETEYDEIDISWYCGSREGFSMWQQSLDPLYYQRPLKERVGIAIDLADSATNGPDVIRLSVALGPLPSLAHSIVGRSGSTLLNAVAYAMGLRMLWSHESENGEMMIGMNYMRITTHW